MAMSYDELKKEVNEFYSDKSRTADQTREALEELIEEIKMMVDTLR